MEFNSQTPVYKQLVKSLSWMNREDIWGKKLYVMQGVILTLKHLHMQNDVASDYVHG